MSFFLIRRLNWHLHVCVCISSNTPDLKLGVAGKTSELTASALFAQQLAMRSASLWAAVDAAAVEVVVMTVAMKT